MAFRDYTFTEYERPRYTKPFGPKQLAIVELIQGSWGFCLWDHDTCVQGEKSFDWDRDQCIAEADRAINEIAGEAKRRADAFRNSVEI